MSKLAVFGGEPIRKQAYPCWPRSDENDMRGLSDVFLSGKWGKGEVTSGFEKRFSMRTGVKHTVVVSNGTVSLEMILRGCGIGYGDEVILPPYTFIATLSAVLFVGATPVFADIDPETYNIDPVAASSRITDKTRAIIAVAVGGCPPALAALSELTEKHNLTLILDAAQAIGAQWNGKDIAGYGQAASFSCQNSKNLTSGEGGIIATHDDKLHESLCSMLDGSHSTFFSDNNITDFQSSLLHTQLDKLDKEIATREHMATYLDTGLKQLPFVRPMRRDKAVTIHAHHLYLMRFCSERLAEKGLSRDMLIRAIQCEGIPLSSGYMPLYSFPCVTSSRVHKMIGCKIDNRPLPHCQTASYREGAWLPQSLLLSDEIGMDDIINALIKLWEHAEELADKLRGTGQR